MKTNQFSLPSIRLQILLGQCLALTAFSLFSVGPVAAQQVSYTLITPEGLSTTYSNFTFRLLAPDGSKVLFNRGDEDGKCRIYVAATDGSTPSAQVGEGQDFFDQNPLVYWTNADASRLGIDYEWNGSGPFIFTVSTGVHEYLTGKSHQGDTEEDGWIFWGFSADYYNTTESYMGPPVTVDGQYAFLISNSGWGWESYVKNGHEYWRPTINVDGRTLLWRAHFNGPDRDPDVIVFGSEQTGFDYENSKFAVAHDGSTAIVLSGQNEVETGYYTDNGDPIKKVVSTVYVCRPGVTTQLSNNANYWGGAAVSGDGQWLAYAEDVEVDGQWLDDALVVQKADGSNKQVVFKRAGSDALDLWGWFDPDMPEDAIFIWGSLHIVGMNGDGSRILFGFEDGPSELWVADRGRGLTPADWGLYRIQAPNYGQSVSGVGISDDGVKVAFLQRGDSQHGTDPNKAYLFVANGPEDPVFKVDNAGFVTARQYVTARADFAEYFPVAASVAHQLEPGDVLALAADGTGVVRAGTHGTSGVVGVYSSAPGLAGGNPGPEDRGGIDRAPVAVVGIVPAKVTAADGPIRPGSLLGLSLSVPGRLGVASPVSFGGRTFVPEAAVVGKALDPLEVDEGMIRVRLVSH